MSGDIVNLRRARKAKARAASANAAAVNRARFGRSLIERAQEVAAKDSAKRHLDGHLLEDGAPRPAAGTNDAES